MRSVELVVVLMAAAVVLTVIARRSGVPYPIFLVLGGVGLAAVPGLPPVELDPEVAFLLFLPPLLFFPALFTSLRDFRSNARPIGLLAVGLVLVTTVVVAAVAHLVVPELPWPVAFVLGAIVAPPDAVAATSIARRVGLPRRVVTVLEGESLVNDATALVAYRLAVAAVVTGTFSALDAVTTFLVGAAGGVLVGTAVALVVVWLRKRLREEPVVDLTVFLLVPWTCYLVAERLHVSGVLAVVTAGFVLARRGRPQVRPAVRIQADAVAETLTFVLNALVCVLIGLQLRPVLDALGRDAVGEVILDGLLISLTVVAVRIVWVWPATYLPRWLSRRLRERDPAPPPTQVAVISWTGMRGIVSLAAVLSLPTVTATGAAFPGRDLLVALVYVVILTTLVGQGLSLPLVVRTLGLHDDGQAEREENGARMQAAGAALRRLEELRNEPWVRPDTLQRLRGQYEFRRRRFGERSAAGVGGAALDGKTPDGERRSADFQRLVRELIAAQRRDVLARRARGEIGDEVLRRIERDLDLEELRLDS